MPLRWSKKLSITDAQQPTQGFPVAYLRFTRSKSPHDTQSWFRTVFFGEANWQPGYFGEHAIERADIEVEVLIDGVSQGIRSMFASHDADRQDNNNTPNTWLHYDEATRVYLASNARAGDYAVLERNDDGEFCLSFQAAYPTPAHSP